MPSWQEKLMMAAQRRARVRLDTDEVGILVYAPGTATAQRKQRPQVRHRDRSKCGVVVQGKRIAVDPTSIVEILDEETQHDG